MQISWKIRGGMVGDKVPSSPNGMYTCSFRNIHDQWNVCIILAKLVHKMFKLGKYMIITASRHFDVFVGHSDIFSIDL